MTKEEIMVLDTEALEERAEAIVVETADADKEALEELNAELDAIAERREVIAAEIETRKKAEAAIIKGEGEVIEERKEETPIMSNMEIRNTPEYIDAFAKYVRTGNDKECRSLLTENASGTIPVPEFVAGIVAEKLKESKLLAKVRKMYAAGNVKVGFEINAPEAAGHEEGGEAIDEEALSLGICTLVPFTLKKWVGVSDEALDTMDSTGYLQYIYEEIARGIVHREESTFFQFILSAPTTATATLAAVGELTVTTPALTDFVDARALLGAGAENLTIAISPTDYATYRGLQMSANYGVDPFDGLEVIVSEYAQVPVIGDFSGFMVNYPKGETPQIKYDDTTLMTSDIVRILGRLPVGMGIVGNKYFARLDISAS